MTRARVHAALLPIAVVGCGGAPADDRPAPLTVFAASDLRRALPEVVRAWRGAGGDSVVVVYGATRALATQIANGAPADAFLAADETVVAGLAARGVVVDSTRTPYAVGRLVLVRACPTAGACPAPTLAALGADARARVAIANPEHAPYGRAARTALERAGLWARVQPRLVVAADVAAAWQLVATGNADAALVAGAVLPPDDATTARSPVPDALAGPLRQSAAVVAGRRRAAGARAFVRFLVDPRAQAVLRAHGFGAP